MMYNPQLDTFLCVVEAGSFSKAAEKLYISAPAVIKQINSLEASLGMKLFDRTHRGLVVTEAGQSIYNDAKYIIGYCKESVQRAKEAMQVSDDVDPRRNLADDAATGICGSVATDPESISGYEV